MSGNVRSGSNGIATEPMHMRSSHNQLQQTSVRYESANGITVDRKANQSREQADEIRLEDARGFAANEFACSEDCHCERLAE